MGPVWDFDSGLANHSSNPEWMKPEGWEPRWGTYFEALMKDPAFRRRMSARWAERSRWPSIHTRSWWTALLP